MGTKIIDQKLNVCGSKNGYWFFKGDKCWFKKYGKNEVLEGPKDIDKTFEGAPTNMDAVAFNGSTYSFFKGASYWTKEYGTKNKVEGPKPLEDWGFDSDEIKFGIDGACFQKQSKIYYFFQSNKYWRKPLGSNNKVEYKGELPGDWKGMPVDLQTGFDDVCVSASGDYWFFKDTLCWKKAYGEEKYEQHNIDDIWKTNSPVTLQFKSTGYKITADPTFTPPKLDDEIIDEKQVTNNLEEAIEITVSLEAAVNEEETVTWHQTGTVAIEFSVGGEGGFGFFKTKANLKSSVSIEIGREHATSNSLTTTKHQDVSIKVAPLETVKVTLLTKRNYLRRNVTQYLNVTGIKEGILPENYATWEEIILELKTASIISCDEDICNLEDLKNDKSNSTPLKIRYRGVLEQSKYDILKTLVQKI